jgi:signal transduction histidine kinase
MRRVLFAVGLFLLLMDFSGTFAQSPNNDSVLIKKYNEQDGIYNEVVDFYMDEHNLLWILNAWDKLRVFDGGNVFVIDSFHSEDLKFMDFKSFIHTEKSGAFIVCKDNVLLSVEGESKINLRKHVPDSNFVTSYPYYFDWAGFANAAPEASVRAERLSLIKKVVKNEDFRPLTDSSFVYRVGKQYHLYAHSRDYTLQLEKKSVIGMQQVLDDILYVQNNCLYAHDPINNTGVKVMLTGDYADDRRNNKLTSNLNFSTLKIFEGAYPLIAFHNRLYRLKKISENTYETTLVCELSFLNCAVSKIAYYPKLDMTVIGTQLEGLFIIRKNHFFPERLPETYRRLKTSKIFYPVCTDDSGRIVTLWSKFSPHDHYFKSYHIEGNLPFGLYIDRLKRVWRTAEKKGMITMFDMELRKQKEYAIDSFSRSTVDFGEDESGNLYSLGNCSVMKLSNGQFITVAALDSFNSRKPVIAFEGMCFAGSGQFYLTSSQGLFTFNSRTNNIAKVKEIPEGWVVNSVSLGDGMFYFTVYDSDAYLFYKNRFIPIPFAKDLGLNETNRVQPDSRGRLWISTNTGLCVISIEELKGFCDGTVRSVFVYKYDKSDGLPILEFNGGLNPSSTITNTGWLAFNSISGLQVFHQDSLKQLFPSRFIRVIELGTKKIIGLQDTILFKNDREIVQLEVGYCYYGNRRILKVECMIDDKGDWAVVEDNKLVIGKLNTGFHDLRLRIKTGFGPDSSSFYIRHVIVRVKPFFYQENWFIALVLLAALTLVIFIINTTIRLRKRNLEIKQKKEEIVSKNASLEVKSKSLSELVAKMEEATCEILRSKEELQDNIIIKERLMSLILHDLRSPLSSQSIMLNQMIQSKTVTEGQMKKMFSLIKSSNDSILKFTRDFLTWYSSQKDGFVVRKSEFMFDVPMGEILIIYKDIATLKKLELSYEGGNILVNTDKNILEIILRNILDNALKYTQKGQVSLVCSRDLNKVNIVIKDTGSGIPEDILHLLENFHTMEAQYELETFGYRFIFTLAQKLGAFVWVENNEGPGASVTLTIPV